MMLVVVVAAVVDDLAADDVAEKALMSMLTVVLVPAVSHEYTAGIATAVLDRLRNSVDTILEMCWWTQTESKHLQNRAGFV